MNANTINGVVGSTFLASTGHRLLIEKELSDGLLNVLQLPSGRQHRVVDPLTGEETMCDVAWLEREVAEHGLKKIADENGPIPPERQIAARLDRAEILKLDPYAEARAAVINGLIELGVEPTDPDLGSHIAKVWAGDLQTRFGDRPNNAAVRSWFGRITGIVATIGDMMSLTGRVKRSFRLDPAVEALIDKERRLYWKHRGLLIIDVFAGVTAKVETENARRKVTGEPLLETPGKETVRRRVNDMFCRETYASKFGEKAARRKFDGSGRGISASRILQICLMDDTIVDLVTCLDADRGMIAGRPYLVVLIDVHSRCVLGLVVSFTPPTVSTAAQCIRMANRPKNDIRPDRQERYPVLAKINGKAARIVTDNGVNYVATGFSEMCLDLAIVHELAPVGSPRHKAIVERFFHTLNTFLIGKLPGATLDPSVLRKLGIDPTANAVVTIGELRELLNDFLYVYHITNHSGIDAAPALKWQRSMAVAGRDMILDERAIDIVTGVTLHGKRITANGGVRLFGLTWKGPGLPRVIEAIGALEPHRRRLDATVAVTTKIKYNPEDLSHVQVLAGGEWIRLDNTQPDYAAGLSLWHHRQIKDWAKRVSLAFNSQKERLIARDELNRSVREAFPDMDARERRAAARMLGRPAEVPFPVEHAVAEARHDGMGPIVEHDPAFGSRTDAHRVQSRPGVTAVTTEPEDDGHDGDDHTPVLREKPLIAPSPSDDDDDAFEEEYK